MGKLTPCKIYISERNRSGNVDLSVVTAFDRLSQSSRSVEAPPDRNRSEIAVGPATAGGNVTDKAAAAPPATGDGSIARSGSRSDKGNRSGHNIEGVQGWLDKSALKEFFITKS